MTFRSSCKHNRLRGKRFQSRKYLEYITSEFDCILFPYAWCKRRPVQAHHLMKPFYSVRGMGLRAGDKDVVPLCSDCHRELHLNGNEEKYFKLITDNENFGREKCQELWKESPYYEES